MTEPASQLRSLHRGAPVTATLVTAAALFVNLVLAAGCGSAPPAVGGSPSLIPGVPLRFEAVVEARGGPWERWMRSLSGEPRPTLLRRPYGVAWDGSHLLVTDPGAGRLLRLDLDGRLRGSFAEGLESPIGVAACEGRVVLTDSARGDVLWLDPDLRLRGHLARNLARPTGVACDGGRVAVTETGAHRVLLFEGTERRSLGGRGDGPGHFNFPTSVLLSGDEVWVGDTLNFRLQRLDAVHGDYLGGFGRLGDAAGDLPRLKGMALDGAGHLWVSDAHLDRVALFRPDGTFLASLGGRGDAPGRFNFPTGIAALPGGGMVVVDSLNRRLQLYRWSGAAGDGGPRRETAP